MGFSVKLDRGGWGSSQQAPVVSYYAIVPCLINDYRNNVYKIMQKRKVSFPFEAKKNYRIYFLLLKKTSKIF